MDEAIGLAMDFDVIGVDEGQFVRSCHRCAFSFQKSRPPLFLILLSLQFEGIADFCEKMSNMGKTVIVAALDGTFQRKPFGHILELVPLAEHVTKLKAVCVQCQGDAAFSKRLGSDTRVELIGGADMYNAVCRQCYFDGKPPGSKPTQPAANTSPSKYNLPVFSS